MSNCEMMSMGNPKMAIGPIQCLYLGKSSITQQIPSNYRGIMHANIFIAHNISVLTNT